MPKAMWLRQDCSPLPVLLLFLRQGSSSLIPSWDAEWLPSSVASREHLSDFSKIEGSYLFSEEREKHPSEPP